jgi:hypothetical protein
MSLSKVVKAIAGFAVVALVVISAVLSSTRVARALDDDDNEGNSSKIRKGFEIAPVHLNLAGKNPALVGLGSYIVNAQADCNGCHTTDPATQYAPGGNPYFGQPTKVNPATYLAGGQDFGPFPGPDSPLHIISRNLTPDKSGRAEGGNTFEQFRQIIRFGTDFDHLHPNLPPPFRGDLLQIMPWPVYRNMSDHELRAIYEYLSAIPCIAGPASPSDLPGPAQYAFAALHNDCK